MILHYKDYTALLIYYEEEGRYYGEVIGLSGGIHFSGATIEEAEEVLEECVEFYIECCQGRGEAPEKPFSGTIPLRIEPEIHLKLSIEAHQKEISLNSLIKTTLKDMLEA